MRTVLGPRGPMVAAITTVLMLMVLLVAPASAWEFDSTTGKVRTTADVAWNCEGLDGLPEGMGFEAFNERFDRLTPLELGNIFEQTGVAALEGEGACVLGGQVAFVSMRLAGLDERFAGRRVSINFWIQPRGTTLGGRAYWVAGGAPPQIGRVFGDPNYLGSVGVKPTGQRTSDGWQEMSTGPVDWSMVSSGAGLLTLIDGQFDRQSFLLAYDNTQSVGFDALEIEDLGPAMATGEACNGVEGACEGGASCLWGRCVDGSVLTDTVPHERVRQTYLERKLYEFKAFEAGVLSQSLMGQLEQTTQELVEEEHGVTFWQRLRESVADLRDGHAAAPFEDFRGQTNGGVCMVMGEADLIPGGGVLPLVASAGGGDVAGRLDVGDVLLSIDGLEPYRWLAQWQRRPTHAGDPVVADYVLTPQVMGAAIQAGATLVFGRCENPEEPCAEGSVEEIEINLAESMGPTIWDEGVPAWLGNNEPCDYRFNRLVGDRPGVAAQYDYVGSSEVDEDTTYLLINGTPDPQTDNGNWGAEVRGGLSWNPSKAILDHRQGGGGTVTGVNLVAGYFLDPDEFYFIDWFAYYGDQWSNEVYEALVDCLVSGSGNGFLQVCGWSYHWDIFESHPDRGLLKDARLAILIGQDVSGNDFLTEVLRRRDGPTRIFGSEATYGAFGTVVGLPTMLGEFGGGSVQISDSIFLDDPYEPGQELPPFTTGVGVPADEIIFQRQSDAIRGVDTVLERAQEWLEEEEGE